LISLNVVGYNCDRGTKKFDIWPIVLNFVFLEGYGFIYNDLFFKPLKEILKSNTCIPDVEFSIDTNSKNCWENYEKDAWNNWFNVV